MRYSFGKFTLENLISEVSRWCKAGLPSSSRSFPICNPTLRRQLRFRHNSSRTARLLQSKMDGYLCVLSNWHGASIR